MSGDQDRALFEALTDKQRECLDRVLIRMTSKEIARDLGISPVSVDQRVLHARLRLGAATRDEAVRLYARLLQTYDRATYDALYLPSALPPLTSSAVDEASHTDTAFREPAMTYADFERLAGAPSTIMEVPWLDLNGASKGVIIIALALAIIMLLLAIVAVSEQLSTLV